MMAASEEMAEFVSEKNGEQSESERKSSRQTRGVLVEKCEGVDKLVDGTGLIIVVSNGELRACYEARTESDKE